MVTTNDILTAVSVGLGAIAVLSLFRPIGNNLIPPNPVEAQVIDPTNLSNAELISAEKQNRISILDDQINFIKEQISKAQAVFLGTNRPAATNRAPRAGQIKRALDGDFSGINTPSLVGQLMEVLGRQNASRNSIESRGVAQQFIINAQKEIDQLSFKRNELTV